MAVVGEALILGLKGWKSSVLPELFSDLLHPFAQYVLSNWKINQCQSSKAKLIKFILGQEKSGTFWRLLQIIKPEIQNIYVVIFPCSTNILLGSPAQGWG